MKSLKAVFSFLLIALMTLGTARAGQVTGTFATPGGSFIQNATITFTLSQLAVKTDASQTVAPLTVSCYTSVDGSLVGLPNPQASPVLAATSGSMTAGTYYEVITYWNASGETLASPEQTVVLSSSQGIQTSSPGLQPAGASGYKIYVGIAPGGEVLQATVTGFATTSIGSLIGGSSPPVSNSTPCNIAFNDTFIPAYTTYRVSALDSTGSPLPGFPQSFYLQGSTVNLNTMYPASGLSARFPQPIVASPINTTTQSINSNLSLNGHQLQSFVTPGPEHKIDLLAYAKGDGVTDDRVAIAAALAAAGAFAPARASICVNDNHTFLVSSNPQPGVAHAMFTMPPNVSMGCKGTIKIGNNYGLYFAVFNWAGSGTTPQTFRDFTIDFNGANNPLTIDPNVSGNLDHRQGFDHVAQNTAALTFQNLTFLNHQGTWTINGNGAVKTIIQGNRWINDGAGGSIDYDHSEIYEAGTDVQVIGNQFECLSIGCRTAIEVHGVNKIVANNIIRGFKLGVIYSVDPGGCSCTVGRNIVISNNVIDHAYLGIEFWSVDGPIDGITISDNNIEPNRNGAWTQVGNESGITWVNSSTNLVKHLDIHGNNIHFDADTATYPFLGGALAGIAMLGNTTNAIVESSITGNTISNSWGTGIYASFNYQGVAITGNTITNPGQDAASAPAVDYRSGILLGPRVASGNTGLTVTANTIIDDQSPLTMQRGIEWAGINGDGVASWGVIKGNTVRFNPAASPTFANYYLIQTSSPFFVVEIPGWSAAANNNFVSFSQFPPLGSQVQDTKLCGVVWQSASTASFSMFAVPTVIAQNDQTGLSAAVGATTLYTTPTGCDGLYRLSYWLTVEQAATTSSAVQILLSGGTGSSGLPTPPYQSANLTGNTTLTMDQGTLVWRASGTSVTQFSTTYSSVGATVMKYRFFIRLEYLGK